MYKSLQNESYSWLIDISNETKYHISMYKYLQVDSPQKV